MNVELKLLGDYKDNKSVTVLIIDRVFLKGLRFSLGFRWIQVLKWEKFAAFLGLTM